jgi:hypothetical protein
MKNSFWGLIWSSFSVIQTFWLGLLGFVASVLAWAFAGQTPIPLVVVFVIITIALLAIATLFRALEKVLEEYGKLKLSIIPKILVVKEENNYILCLLEPSELFSHGMTISFYYTNEDNIEALIADGFIKTIQSDRKIQAVIDRQEPAYQDILKRLVNKEQKIIDKVTVKPGNTRNFSSP